jgi:hypothetical protein
LKGTLIVVSAIAEVVINAAAANTAGARASLRSMDFMGSSSCETHSIDIRKLSREVSIQVLSNLIFIHLLDLSIVAFSVSAHRLFP